MFQGRNKVIYIKIILFIFILLYSFLPITTVLSPLKISLPFKRDYRLTGADVTVELHKDGNIDIGEQIDYKFKKCFKEVYRILDIYHPSRAEPSQIQVPYITKLKANCNPKCMIYDRGYEVAGNFGRICDQDANFFIDFTVLKGIIIGDDVAELHYKIWGEKWDKSLEKLQGKIILPSNIDKGMIDVFFNPLNIVEDYSIEGNVIKFNTNKFHNYLEVRLLMPKEAFNAGENAQNFLFNNNLIRENVIEIQEKYKNTFYIVHYGALAVYILIASLMLIIPIFVFLKYGREPKIDYEAVFEREPVRGVKPYVINSLCMGRTGDTDRNAITATLMDLVRRKHINVREESRAKKGLFGSKTKKETILSFLENPNDKLSRPEQTVYDMFKNYSNDNNELVWSEFLKELKTRSEAKHYMERVKDFEKQVDNDYEIKSFFDSKGNKVFTISTVILFLIGLAFFIGSKIFPASNYPILKNYALLTVFLFFYLLVGIFIPLIFNRVFGRFTPQGYLIYRKSMNFKKFMTDMTLLKQYPPSSIVIWEEQLVYATLFGVANKVIKCLKANVDERAVRSSRLYLFYNTSIITSIGRSYNVAAHSSSARGGGFGGGGIGGGFGGGGGGAR